MNNLLKFYKKQFLKGLLEGYYLNPLTVLITISINKYSDNAWGTGNDELEFHLTRGYSIF